MSAPRRAMQQRQIGTPTGTIKLIASSITPYAGWLSLALIGVTSFYTTINPILAGWGISLPFWVFCLIIILLVLGIAALEWVFMMPSYYRANNQQTWDAGGPLQDKLEALGTELTAIKKMLADLHNRK